MKQEFQSSPIRHLMIFLRETPPDGIEGFERKIIHHATYHIEGSKDTRYLVDRIGDDTKIKVLVTGDIELNEKNVFIGLKMAFPEWDFQSYPLNIQRLLLKRQTWANAKEVGVIATTDLTRSSDGNQWGAPCVFNMPVDQDDQFMKQGIKKDTPSLYEPVSSWKSSHEEQIDFSDEFFEKDNGKGNSQEIQEDIDFARILDLAKDISSEELTKEVPPDPPDQLNFKQELLRRRELSKKEDISGEDSNEFLKHFDEEKKSTSSTSLDEDETFDFSFLEEASTFSPTLTEMGKENLFSQERYETQPFIDEEEDYISPAFHEPAVEFELEGVVEKTYTGEDPSPQVTIDEKEQFSSLPAPFQKVINKLQSVVYNRIKDLPLRKIALMSLITGAATIALSFGVKVFEPDYEAIRKSAGIVDLYDWIIINDLVGPDTETDSLIDQWKESSEYDQFWQWYDTQWFPRISRYQKIEAGLRKVGGVLLSPAVVILMIALIGRAAPIVKKQSQFSDYDRTNRISLSFTTYTSDWSIVDTWADEAGFKILEVEGGRRLYRRKGTLIHPPILCLIAIEYDHVQLEVWVSTRVPTFLVPLLSDLGVEVLEAKKGVLPVSIKGEVNKLLLKLGHPPLA